MPDPFLAQGGFARPVPPDGYAWWYVDAISDCGRHGLTLILFVGSVFSPYYAWKRRQGAADPYRHCALNIALYGRPGAWTMTERGRGAIDIGPDRFRIGPSRAHWQGGALVFDLAERTFPWGHRVQGRVRVTPQPLIDHAVTLDTAGRHRWRPLAPRARVEVSLTHPQVAWSGPGYLDSNNGDEPLERGFSAWNWSRMVQGDDTLVLYDATRRDGTSLNLARSFAADCTPRDVPPPPPAQLRRGIWGVARPTRADAGTTPSLVRRLEDAPFYTRSEIRSTLLGRAAHGVHESLDLDRFANPVVQAMLPFRMPRRARAGKAAIVPDAVP